MIEINNKTRKELPNRQLKKIIECFLGRNDKTGYNVSIAFVGDATIKRLNRQYRGIDRVTDVLSFSGEDDFLGEIIIDPAQIERQAKRFRSSTYEELVFILVHGLLHLLGYRDDTDKGKKEMIALGEEFISSLKMEIGNSDRLYGAARH